MHRAIIVDDELHCIESLHILLEPYRDFIHVMGEFSNVEDTIVGIQKLKPDLIFLDIQLGNDTCFSILKEFEELDFEIIFTTGYNEYALKAIEISGPTMISYLMKPILKDRLEKAIMTLQKKSAKNIEKKILSILESNFYNIQHNIEAIQFPVANNSGYDYFKFAAIIRMEASGSYTSIILNNKKQNILSTKNIGYYADLFEKLKLDHFFRIHKSHIINIYQVTKYQKGKGGIVIMSDGSTLDVAARRKEEFVKFMNKYS